MFMKTRLLFFCFTAIASVLSAQSLTFSTFTEPYNDLTNATLAVEESWDDPTFSVPLGFAVDLLGEECTTIAASDFFLGGIVGTNSDITSLNLILTTTADLIDPNYFNGEEVTAPISYVTEGMAGDRIFKLEWKNAGFYEEVVNGTAANLINLQLWIYEQDGAIEVRYGPNTIKETEYFLNDFPTTGVVVGIDLFGEEGDFDGAAVLSGTSANPDYIVSNNLEDLFDAYFTDIPQNGRVYRFANDGPINIEESALASLNVWPTTVYNELTASSDAPGSVIFEIRDLSGRLCEQGSFAGSTRIAMSHYSEGIYLVTLRVGASVKTFKVLKV